MLGFGSTYANTAAGTSGQPLVSGGAGAPVFRPYTLPATDGSANQLLQTNGSGALSFATVSAGFTLGTPVASTSGTSINFTLIPAGVKQIVISFKNVSTSGTSAILVQLGDAGGINTSSYGSAGYVLENSVAVSGGSSSSGFRIRTSNASNQLSGNIILMLENSTTFSWSAAGSVSDGANNTDQMYLVSGGISLSATLDRVRITTVNGTDTFDLGEINIAYI